MQQDKLRELVRKYLDGSASHSDRVRLNAWYRELTSKELPWYVDAPGEAELLKAEMLQQILTQTGITKRLRIRKLWFRVAAAATVLLFLSFGGYFLLRQQPNQQQITLNNKKTDLLPGRNKAILILSNGQQVNLNNAPSGVIATQANANIKKSTNGDIRYQQTGQTTGRDLIYNTVRTLKGEQWPSLELPDGSIVHLDAASSITFPVSFPANERMVSITGQVYFEVAHRVGSPFRVTVKGQTIEDIGTHFNVNAYDDEPVVRTTLIEGALSVAKAGKKEILKPGQEAVTKGTDNAIIVENADIDDVIAWRNGLFKFNNTPMPVVMRQLSRWYNVEVEYSGKVPATVFTGEMHRNVNASHVLDMLTFFKVHFRIEDSKSGRKIIVLP